MSDGWCLDGEETKGEDRLPSHRGMKEDYKQDIVAY